MLNEEQLAEAMRRALSYSTAEQTEVVIEAQEQGLARYANNIIHQHVYTADAKLTVRAVFGQRSGVASTNRLDDDALRDVVRRAAEIAKQQPPNPDFVSLPGPQPLPDAATYDDATRNASPTARAEAVKLVLERAKQDNLVTAGALSTAYHWLGVANSLGVFATHGRTHAGLTTTQISANSTGYWESHSDALSRLDVAATADHAASTALATTDPQTIEPSEYDVVLSPLAVADLILYLAYIGFSALDVQEETSFLVGHFGEQLISPLITLYDDGGDPQGLPMPFDYEGQPKQRVNFFERGISQEVVYDSLTASKAGRQTSGHAQPPPSRGPQAGNIFLAPGDSSEKQMIASTEHGVYVTRFWYNRVVHPTKTILTGMTRDGAYLISEGKLAGGIKNLRYTESIVRALNNVQMVGNQPLIFAGDGSISVPALKIVNFTFTGRTE